MKKVLIANKDIEEGQKLEKLLGQQFDVTAICSPAEQPDDMKDFRLVLIDSNFTESYGVDFLEKALNNPHLPVLIATPPDNPKHAAEALKLGAFNYIIKTDHYYEAVDILIKEAIHKFDQFIKMNQIIIDLKQKVNELEKQSDPGSKVGKKPDEVTVKEPAKQKGGVTPEKPRGFVFDDIIARLKKGEINLPTPPQIPIKFEEMIRNRTGFHDVAKLLKQDMSISSQLISVSNSAYYQGMAKNTTVEQAITRLGLNTTRKYVEIICNRSLYSSHNKKNVEWLEKLWKHSLSCALAAQQVCEITQQNQAEEVFTMALFHDIGMLILLQIMGELDVDISDDKMSTKDRAEIFNTLSLNHCAFGAMLLKRWGFSNLHQQIALLHKNPEKADPVPNELLIVHFSNLLSKSLGYQVQKESEANIEEALSENPLKLGPEKIAEVKQKVTEHMSNLQGIF